MYAQRKVILILSYLINCLILPDKRGYVNKRNAMYFYIMT